MPNYYLHREGQNHGPYTVPQMQQLLASGQVAAEEPVCAEGSSDWVTAGSLAAAPAPATATGPAPSRPGRSAPGTQAQAPGTRRPAAAPAPAMGAGPFEEQPPSLRPPILGIVFSIFLPVIFFAAKSDASRGVRPRGKHAALEILVKNNMDLLPYAVLIGIIGLAVSIIWLTSTLKKVKKFKAQMQRG